MTKNEKIIRLKSLISDYYTALEYAQAGKSYKIGTRELTRYDLTQIEKTIEWLEQQLLKVEAGIGTRAFVRPRRGR